MGLEEEIDDVGLGSACLNAASVWLFSWGRGVLIREYDSLSI